MANAPDPEELLRQVLAGNNRVLGDLLEMYRNYLKLMAWFAIDRRLQAKVDASDLVQDTFLEAHRDFGGFRGKTEKELTGWLRTILATNVANLIRHFRGTQRRDVRLEREIAGELDQSSQCLDMGLVAGLSSPSHQASKREQVVILADALMRLPKDYREVIILRNLKGMSLGDVARKMGRSEDSVKKLWVRGLANLKGKMGEDL